MILDQFGNEIDLANARRGIDEPQTAHVGWVSREFDEHPARGLTPATLQAILQDGERGDITAQLDLADDIEERDGHCFAELDKRAGAVASLSWSINEPDNATPAEVDLTARVREWVGAIAEFEDLVRGMMSATLRAFACHEMVWSPQTDGSGKQVLLPSITFRPQRWFTVDRNSRNTLLLRTNNVQSSAANSAPASSSRRTTGSTATGTADTSTQLGEPLQPFSWIAHTHKTRNGYLARMGLVRVLAWPYLFKNFAVRDLAEFLEIYGLPLRLGKYPSGASDEEKRRLLQAVVQIGHNAAGIIPAGMAIDFQAAAVGTEVPFDSMQDRMEAVQSKVILGQTLSSSEGKNGTQALGTVHNEVRHDIRDSDARQIEATLKRQLIMPLVLLNMPGAAGGADLRRLPCFDLDTTEPEDMKAYADNLPKLVSLGMKIGTKWAQDKLRIPQPEEGEEVLQASAVPGDPNADPNAEPRRPGESRDPLLKKAAALKAATGTDPNRDQLDDLVDDAVSDWQPLLAPLVSPLLAELDRAVAAGETLAAFRARLPNLVTQMDYAPMGERLARAAFVAGLAGAADLELSDESGSRRSPG